jgi:hypothetical protein
MHAHVDIPVTADQISRVLAQPLPTWRRAAIVATTGEGRVAYWNAGAERLFAWRACEALSQDIMKLTPAAPTHDKAAEILAYLQSGRPWLGEMAMRRRCGLPLVAFVMQFPLGDLAHGRGAIVGVTVPTAQRRLVERDAARIAAALARRLDGGRASHPHGRSRLEAQALRVKPGVYIPIGSTKHIAALHRRSARPRDLWRLMQRIETYRYRAEQLARSPERLRSGRNRLIQMWLQLADELHRLG